MKNLSHRASRNVASAWLIPRHSGTAHLVTVQFVCRREATIRRSTLATALVAVFISYLATPAAVKTGGYVRTDRVVNKSPLIDKNGISHTGQVQDPNLLNPWSVTEIPTGSPFWVSDNNAGGCNALQCPSFAHRAAQSRPGRWSCRRAWGRGKIRSGEGKSRKVRTYCYHSRRSSSHLGKSATTKPSL